MATGQRTGLASVESTFLSILEVYVDSSQIGWYGMFNPCGCSFEMSVIVLTVSLFPLNVTGHCD